jgi:hypothetical protein
VCAEHLFCRVGGGEGGRGEAVLHYDVAHATCGHSWARVCVCVLCITGYAYVCGGVQLHPSPPKGALKKSKEIFIIFHYSISMPVCACYWHFSLTVANLQEIVTHL